MKILWFSRVRGWSQLWLLLPFLLLGGCAGPSLDDYQDRSPALVPDQFFAGNLSARGVVKTGLALLFGLLTRTSKHHGPSKAWAR